MASESGGGTRRAFTLADPERVPGTIDLQDDADRAGASVPAAVYGVLHPLVEALMRAVSMSDVAASAVAYGAAAVEARWARAVLLDRSGAVAVSLLGGQVVRSRGPQGGGFGGRTPWMDVVRRGVTLEFSSPQDVRNAYPGIDEIQSLPGEGAVIALPLGSAGRGCGAVAFGFDESGPLTDRVRAILAEVARLSAYAAQRALVYDAENRAAETFQHAYLPDRLANVCGLTFAARCLSASEPWGVAGDWSDVLSLPGPLVGMVMGDVAGHGIPAATTMAALRGAVRAFSTVEASPAAILARMSTYMRVFKPEAFATLVVAVYDPANGGLRFARAGHPPILLVRPDGTSAMLDEPFGPPLGVPDAGYDEGEVPLPPGTTLVIYTDGLIERRDGCLDASMAELVRTASRHRSGLPERLCDRLVEGLAGSELSDDVSLLVAVRDGGAAAGPTGA